MEVFVVHISHDGICKRDEVKRNKTPWNSVKLLRKDPQAVNQTHLVRTIVDHYAKLLQKKVDIGVVLPFPSFTEQDQDVSSSVQVLLQHLHLK